MFRLRRNALYQINANLFHEPTRRVDLVLGVSYGDDIAHVRRVIEGVIASIDTVIPDPGHEIWLAEHGASSINFKVRVWCNSEDYWPTYFNVMEQAKLAFDREGVSIPFPQRDVHMIPPSAA